MTDILLSRRGSAFAAMAFVGFLLPSAGWAHAHVLPAEHSAIIAYLKSDAAK